MAWIMQSAMIESLQRAGSDRNDQVLIIQQFIVHLEVCRN